MTAQEHEVWNETFCSESHFWVGKWSKLLALLDLNFLEEDGNGAYYEGLLNILNEVFRPLPRSEQGLGKGG